DNHESSFVGCLHCRFRQNQFENTEWNLSNLLLD
ncbi:unnamed protein product, partial [Allacma fusca]